MITLRSCTLRPYRAGDEAALSLAANDREIWMNLRDRFPHPYTEADATAWIAYASAQPPGNELAIDVDGAVAGAIGIIPQHDVHARSAEIGYWLGRAHRGKGIATEALVGLTEYVFASSDVCRLFGAVFEHNVGSARVLEKAGYTLEGRLKKSIFKDGQIIDSLLYARVR